MTTIGYATLQIIPSLKGVSEAIDKQLAGMPGMGKDAGKHLGSNIAAGVRGSEAQISAALAQAVNRRSGEKAGKDWADSTASAMAQHLQSAQNTQKLQSSLAYLVKNGDQAGKKFARDMASNLAIELPNQTRAQQVGEKVGAVIGRSIGFGIKAAAVGIIGAAGVTLFKGFERLQSIDQATFKLKALGHSAEETKLIMDNALASVKGTAFNLGDAATAAASAVAAGIKPGQDLTKYLTEVGDAAAVAGTSFGDMASIFNKIQTSNKAYTDDLNQLADRGIPIFQWLQKEYGVTADALTKMVEKGEIDSAHFQHAIDSNIGGAGKKMGQSFDGAVQNMEASVARLGANLITAILGGPGGGSALEGPTEAIGRLTTKFDEIGAWVQSHGPEIHQFFVDMVNGIKPVAEALGNITGFLVDHPHLIEAVVIAFAGWKAITVIGTIATGLRGLGDLLGGLPGKARGAKDGIDAGLGGDKGKGGKTGWGAKAGNVARGAGGIFGPLALLSGLDNPNVPDDVKNLPSLDKASRPGSSTAATIGGGAATGAWLGGWPGAAVGSAVGAVIDRIKSNQYQKEIIDKYKDALKNASEESKLAILNQFYGENIADPRNVNLKDLDPSTMIGGTVRKQLMKPEVAKLAGIPAGDSAAADKFLASAREQIAAVSDGLNKLGNQIETLPSGEIVLKDPTPEVLKRVSDLGLSIKTLPNGKVAIDVDTAPAKGQLNSFINSIQNTAVTLQVAVRQALAPPPAGPGHAGGGPIFGSGPKGKDSVPIWAAPGEHMLTAGDVDAMGGQGGVYAFRRMLHRAGGGAIGNITSQEQQTMWDSILAAFPDAVLTSATRTNQTEGHPDYHNAGRAIDISGPSMDRIAAWIAQNYPDSLELIHAPFGHNIKNGKDVGDGSGLYGAHTMSGHHDHVHWALGHLANAIKAAQPPTPQHAQLPTTAPETAPTTSSGDEGSTSGISLPSSISGLASWPFDEMVKKGEANSGPGHRDPMAYFPKAASAAVSGQISSALGVFGVGDSPGWLKAAATLASGISIGKGKGSTAAPIAATGQAHRVPQMDDAHGTQWGQNPQTVNNWTINARDTEDSFIRAQRIEREKSAAKLSRY